MHVLNNKDITTIAGFLSSRQIYTDSKSAYSQAMKQLRENRQKEKSETQALFESNMTGEFWDPFDTKIDDYESEIEIQENEIKRATEFWATHRCINSEELAITLWQQNISVENGNAAILDKTLLQGLAMHYQQSSHVNFVPDALSSNLVEIRKFKVPKRVKKLMPCGITELAKGQFIIEEEKPDLPQPLWSRWTGYFSGNRSPGKIQKENLYAKAGESFLQRIRQEIPLYHNEFAKISPEIIKSRKKALNIS